MRETRGYLEFVVDVAEKQVSQPSEGRLSKLIVRLAEKAVCIANRWNKLQYKVKYLGNILSVFSKPLACLTFDMDSGILWLVFHLTSTLIFFFGFYLQGFLETIFFVVSLLPPIRSFIHTSLNLSSAFGICGIISCRVRIFGPESTPIQPHLRPSVSLSRMRFDIITAKESKEFNPLLEKCCSLIWLLFALDPRSYIFTFFFIRHLILYCL